MIVLITLLVVAAVAAGAVALFIWKRKPQALDSAIFQDQWRELQGLLRNKDQWGKAIMDADNLLDSALKKRRFRGRSMGERLVKAQRLFTDNDSVWFGHKLRKSLDADPATKLKETDVKQALLGIRQALKDVGALPDAKSRSSK
jgi:hypothetical protein